MKRLLLSFVIVAVAANAQLSFRDPRWQTVGAGTLAARPATCKANKDVYICIGAGCTNGQNVHYCRATDTWEVQGVAAGGGITSLNALVGATQLFAVGTAGTDFAVSSETDTHTFNLPTASGTNRGALSSADWTTFNGKIGGTLSANRVPFASGASTLTDSANFRFTSDVSFDRLYIAADGVSGFQFKRAAGANTLQLRRHDDVDWSVLELGILRSKNSSDTDRFVVDPGAATVTIPGSYLDMTGGTMGWPSTTVASLPAAASNTGKVYVVTDSTSAGDCGTGSGSERAICRSNGSAWQSIGRDGGAGGGAPSDATYITKTANGTLSAEFALGTLSTGFLQVTTTTGDLASRTIAAGAGISVANGDGSGGNPTVSVDTATIASLDTIQRNTALYLADAGASDAYSASPTPTPTGSIATGSIWTLKPNTANTGASTVDVDAGGALAAVAIKYANGSTDTATGDILAGDFLQFLYDGTAMRLPPVIVNSGNVRGKLPLANLTAPSAGQYIYSSDGVTASSRQPLFSDLGGNASANQLGSSVNAQTGTTYTILNGDRGKLVTHTNAGSIAVTLPQAGSGGNFANDWFYCTQNRGAGTVTITPTTSTIDGAASLALTTNQGACIWSDATNYFTMRGIGGAGSPGGSDTHIQFNDGGSFGGQSSFTFNKTTGTMVLNTGSGTNTFTLRDASISKASGADFEFSSGIFVGAGKFEGAYTRLGNGSSWARYGTDGDKGHRFYSDNVSTFIFGITNTGVIEEVSPGGPVATWEKYTISETALTAAGLTQDITIVTPGARFMVTGVRVKSSTAFAGTGVTDVQVSVGRTGDTTFYTANYDLDVAVSDTNIQNTSLTKAATHASEAILARFTSQGANLDQMTAGSVDIWIRWEVLP